MIDSHLDSSDAIVEHQEQVGLRSRTPGGIENPFKPRRMFQGTQEQMMNSKLLIPQVTPYIIKDHDPHRESWLACKEI